MFVHRCPVYRRASRDEDVQHGRAQSRVLVSPALRRMELQGAQRAVPMQRYFQRVQQIHRTRLSSRPMRKVSLHCIF